MISRTKNRLLGHVRTIVPSLRHRIVPFSSPTGSPWKSTYDDYGRTIPLHGIAHRNNNRSIVIVVHGLGGDPNSAYMAQWSTLLTDAGFDVLRLGLRGSDGHGESFYHVGLTADVEHAISVEAKNYDNVFLLGFSLGAHITLCCATLGLPLTACCAISPPADLVAGVEFLDRAPIYRRYILNELVEMYGQLLKNGAKLPVSLERVKKVKTIREWDSVTIVPHFGFVDVHDYYTSAAMRDRMKDIVTPTYALVSPDDPMISIDFVKPFLDEASDALQTKYISGGGHVFFPYGREPSIASDVFTFFNNAK